MKYLKYVMAVSLVAAFAWAAQDTTLDGMREVRDPVKLKAWLEANAGDAETRLAAIEATEAGGELAPAYILVGDATTQAVAVAVSGDVTISTAGAVAIGANKVTEAMLKAVDTASDEDFLSYESTTGDFEWHSTADIAGKMAALGKLSTNVIVDGSTTNTIVLRTLTSGMIVLHSWTK